MSMVITGVAAATQPIVAAQTQIVPRTIAATRKAAADMERAQRDEVPVLSGRTRRSIRTRMSVSAGEVSAQVGTSWHVAWYLQYGTVNMPRKMDLHGVSRPIAEQWLEDIADAASPT